MPAKNTASPKKETGFPISHIALSSVIGTVLFFTILFIEATVMLKTTSTQPAYLVYGIAAGCVSGFLNGFIALKLIKEKGIAFGAISGLIQSLLCLLIICILNKGVAGTGIFILALGVIFFSALGGLTAVNFKKKIKY